PGRRYSPVGVICATYLASQRIRPLLAGDGFMAVRVVVSDQPDVIVMDLSLPRVDGWEAMRRLKTNMKTAHIPIIAITGRVDGGSGTAAIEAGCDAYLVSPAYLN